MTALDQINTNGSAPPQLVPKKNRIGYADSMAYINVGSDGRQLVGPLGIKKAEQELIKRRYK